EMSRQIGGRLQWFWEARVTAAEAYRALNKPDEAERALDDAIAVTERARANVVGSEADEQRFLEGRLGPYYSMVDLLLSRNKAAQALSYAERAKAAVLLGVLRGRTPRIDRVMTAEELQRDRELSSQLAAANELMSRERRQQRPDPSRLSDLSSRLQSI